ncbi:MAG: hypothetical protein EXS69_01305 [Candidatus Zambryskibacteria bacterium]|nr:hypothetical protein [Candidatus Zambryskibacteria bacterium]
MNEFFQQDIFGNVVKVVLEGEEIDAIGPQARSDFNIFALTDAIGARKKRDAWVLYQKALASGMVAEEVFFKLVWQVKTMLIANSTSSAIEADMKPFTYNKAKSFLKNFSTSELQNLSKDLVLGYHQARRGEGEIETLVEKTLLKL